MCPWRCNREGIAYQCDHLGAPQGLSDHHGNILGRAVQGLEASLEGDLGELLVRLLQEFFLMKDKGICRVGFDEYDERFEDATDLYRKHMRSEFGDLESAVDFVIRNAPITIDDLLRA